MEYYCPKCKCRHSIDNISADLGKFISKDADKNTADIGSRNSNISDEESFGFDTSDETAKIEEYRLKLQNFYKKDIFRSKYIYSYQKAKAEGGYSSQNEMQEEITLNIRLSLNDVTELFINWVYTKLQTEPEINSKQIDWLSKKLENYEYAAAEDNDKWLRSELENTRDTKAWIYGKFSDSEDKKKLIEIIMSIVENEIKHMKLNWDRIVVDREFILTFLKQGEDRLFQSVTTKSPGGSDETYYDRKCCGYSRADGEICGHKLSEFSGQAPEIVVALAGSQRSGKTSYVISLIDTLQKYGRDHGMEIITSEYDVKKKRIGDKDIEPNEKNEVETMLDDYAGGKVVTKTGTELNAENLTYTFRIKIGRETRVLTLIDMPGEFWSGPDGRGLTDEFLNKYRSIYKTIDYIWFFISKLCITGLNNANVSQKIIDTISKETADSELTLQAVDPLTIEKTFKLIKQKLGRVPRMAVSVSKIDYRLPESDIRDTDLIDMKNYNLFPTDQAVSIAEKEDIDNLMSGNALRLEPIVIANDSVHNYLTYRKKDLTEKLNDYCDEKAYFAFSAYGHTIYVRDELWESPTHYRTLYPFVWSMALLGLVPVRIRYAEYRKNICGRQRMTRNKEKEVDIYLNGSYADDTEKELAGFALQMLTHGEFSVPNIEVRGTRR